jgi:hypothetical protein
MIILPVEYEIKKWLENIMLPYSYAKRQTRHNKLIKSNSIVYLHCWWCRLFHIACRLGKWTIPCRYVPDALMHLCHFNSERGRISGWTKLNILYCHGRRLSPDLTHTRRPSDKVPRLLTRPHRRFNVCIFSMQ